MTFIFETGCDVMRKKRPPSGLVYIWPVTVNFPPGSPSSSTRIVCVKS